MHNATSFQDFGRSVEASLQKFMVSASKINQCLYQHSLLVKSAIRLQLRYINSIMHSADSIKLHGKVRYYIGAVEKFRDDNTSSKYFNHLAAVCEGIQVLLWISTAADPVSYIRDVEACVRFYTDRIVREYNDQHHLDWVKAWLKLISDVEKLSRKYKPITVSSHAIKIKPLELDCNSTCNSIDTIESTMDLPSSRCDGRQWIIENQCGGEKITLEKTEVNHNVFIRNCIKSDIIIKGKVNSIAVDNCKNTSIVFDCVVSSIEFINCDSVQMQVCDRVPTISVYRSDGCQIYLCSTSMDSEIVTSISTHVNVLVPIGKGGEYKELPIPEQFKTVFNAANKLETFEMCDHVCDKNRKIN